MCCSCVTCVCDVFEQEEFCFPVECLALTVQEVMHIRQVLVKAELEKFQQYKDVYNALKKGKVSITLTFTSKKKPTVNIKDYLDISHTAVEKSPYLILILNHHL